MTSTNSNDLRHETVRDGEVHCSAEFESDVRRRKCLETSLIGGFFPLFSSSLRRCHFLFAVNLINGCVLC